MNKSNKSGNNAIKWGVTIFCIVIVLSIILPLFNEGGSFLRNKRNDGYFRILSNNDNSSFDSELMNFAKTSSENE